MERFIDLIADTRFFFFDEFKIQYGEIYSSYSTKTAYNNRYLKSSMERFIVTPS